MEKKLSLSYRIDDISPSHIRISVFSNMVLSEYDHTQVTRAKAGDLCLSAEEFGAFVAHTHPHIISYLKDEFIMEAKRMGLFTPTGDAS